MTGYRAKWTGRTAQPFVEVAEALGVDTDLVMAATEVGGHVYALFTPEREGAEDPSNLRGVTLVRDDDGVLRQETEPVEVPEVTEAMKRLLGER